MKSFVIAALFASAQAVKVNRGDAWPGVILPGSEPIMPKPSAHIDLQIGVEAQARSNVRETLKQQLRSALAAEDNHPVESQLIALKDEDDTVEGARLKAAQMQAQLDKAVADADAKRAEQQKQFEAQDSSDPAAQLQGLMNAQASLKRLTSAFTNKPNLDKVTDMAKKLGIPMTPELMQLGNNEAISNALVEIAVGMGKTESQISAALGTE